MTDLVRTVGKIGTRGKDVEALTRAQFRYFEDWQGLSKFSKRSTVVRRTYDPWDRARTKQIQKLEGIPQSGVIGPHTFAVLEPHMDAYANALMAQAAVDLKPRTVLVEPKQGFSSLDKSLWHAYSVGRSAPYNLSDLGTYNPASRLPSGRPSDHSVYPAMAFDLGIDPDTGWNNLKARAYVLWAASRPEVEYVILGDRIYFGATSWHRYTAGGHQNHVHVSGLRA